VWSLAWAPNGRYLASASDDRTVRIWKRITEHEWECVLVLEEHNRTIYSVTWGNGKPEKAASGSESLGWLASTGADGRINVWEFEVGHRFIALRAWLVLTGMTPGITGIHK
jgi:WD40 repeat protein